MSLYLPNFSTMSRMKQKVKGQFLSEVGLNSKLLFSYTGYWIKAKENQSTLLFTHSWG